jgi:hypothetical protein
MMPRTVIDRNTLLDLRSKNAGANRRGLLVLQQIVERQEHAPRDVFRSVGVALVRISCGSSDLSSERIALHVVHSLMTQANYHLRTLEDWSPASQLDIKYALRILHRCVHMHCRDYDVPGRTAVEQYDIQLQHIMKVVIVSHVILQPEGPNHRHMAASISTKDARALAHCVADLTHIISVTEMPNAVLMSTLQSICSLMTIASAALWKSQDEDRNAVCVQAMCRSLLQVVCAGVSVGAGVGVAIPSFSAKAELEIRNNNEDEAGRLRWINTTNSVLEALAMLIQD